MKVSLFCILLLISVLGFGSNDKVFAIKQNKAFASISVIEIDTSNPQNINKTKLIAVSLAITLGVFGVHRLYLGTKSTVPIAYTLTLGGGMAILPLVDIFYIIAAKDINQITNNEFVFMWNKEIAKKPIENTISPSN